MAVYLHKVKNKKFTYLQACYTARTPKGYSKKIVLKNFGRMDKLLEQGVTIENLEKEVAELDKQYKADREAGKISSLYSEDDYVKLFKEKNPEDIDFEKDGVNLSLSHLPLRYMWEKLNLDKLFQKITYDYRRRSKLKTKTASEITFNLDKHLFFLIASRICAPASKRKTSSFSRSFAFDYSDVTLPNIYRSLDILHENKSFILKTLDNNIRKIRKRNLSLCLFDVTTFYCESFEEDNLRAKGMSKDGKFRESQIVMALIVDADGLPLTYRLFRGDTPEIKTFSALISELKEEFNIDDMIVVADAGLNSIENINFLMENNLKFVLNFPISNRLKQDEKVLLLKDKNWFEYGSKSSRGYYKLKEFAIERKIKIDDQNKNINMRFISKFSNKRYSKDNKDIDTLVTKAAKNLAKGSAYVEAVSRSSQACLYKDATKQKKERIKVEKVLNQSLIEKRRKIAGYSGLVTNIDDLAMNEASNILSQLTKIESNFRLYKTNLVTRPIYVSKEEHVEGHFLSCFLALTLGKLLHLELKEAGLEITYNELIEQLNRYFLNLIVAKQKSKETLIFNISNITKELAVNDKEQSKDEINFYKILKILDSKIDIQSMIKYRFFFERELKALFHTRLKIENLSKKAFTTIK